MSKTSLKKRQESSLKTVVIKLGTSIMTGRGGHISKAVLNRIVTSVATNIKQHNLRVVLVSSGSIGLGMEVLKLKRRPKDLASLQACAAVGQGKLMRLYEEAFSKFGLHTGQVLLTRDEFEERKLYLNAYHTLTELLNRGVVPIINENDTVATQEIQLGDNDTLAAMTAKMLQADLTILLSDVDGFFLKDKTRVENVIGLREVNKLKGHLFTNNREKTVGGMKTKLAAARTLMQSGQSLLIANGRDPKILTKVFAGENVGTFFLGSKRMSAFKNKIKAVK
jgi:glutamate 5-kinase